MAVQKLVGSLIIVISLIAVTCFAEHNNPETDAVNNEVKITNNLDACIKITQKQTIDANGFLLLTTNWQTEKSTGECGCKSALINYSVNVRNGTQPAKIIMEAVISSLEKKEYSFILNADSSVKYSGAYELKISCQNPN